MFSNEVVLLTSTATTAFSSLSPSQDGTFTSSTGTYTLKWNDVLGKNLTLFTYSVSLAQGFKYNFKDADNCYAVIFCNFFFLHVIYFYLSFFQAFGFSIDQRMGEDNVVVCKISAGVMTVEHMFNPNGRDSPVYLDSSQKSIGISTPSISLENGVLTCKFTREKFLSNVENYYDLTKETYFLLVVKGSVSSGEIIQHDDDFETSNIKIDFQKSDSFAGVIRSYEKAKAHGCLMIIAWILFASVGIIFARYCYLFYPKFDWIFCF